MSPSNVSSSSSSALLQIENYGTSCSTEYNVLMENFYYGAQAFYLVATLFFLIWILVTVRYRFRADYDKNIWFWIYSVDCVASVLLILLDLFITRLFLYVPQLCAVFSKLFIDYPLINHIYFPLYNYLRAIKPVTHCAMIMIRFSCVKHFASYDKKWVERIRGCILTVCLLPLLVIWNTAISEKEVVFWRGGFFIIYHRYIKWASLSMFHISFLLIAITTTLVTSILIIRRLDAFDYEQRPQQLMCVASAFIAFAFFLQAAFQSYYAVFRHCWWFPSILVDLQFVIYDVLTVGTPMVIVKTSSGLQERLWKSGPKTATGTKQNFLEGDPKV